MDLLGKIIINWLLLDLLIVTTIWYGTSTLRFMFPYWWRTHICDEAPDYFD